MSVFAQAAASMLASLKGAAGVEVHYVINTAGGTGDDTIIAVPSQSVLETIDSGGRVVQVTTFDWIIDRRDVKLGGATFRPERGDKIIRYNDLGALIAEYVVFDPPYKPMDAESRMLRIYTKKTREEF
jgi:hypothetical protein